MTWHEMQKKHNIPKRGGQQSAPFLKNAVLMEASPDSQVSGWRKFCQPDIRSGTWLSSSVLRFSSPPVDHSHRVLLFFLLFIVCQMSEWIETQIDLCEISWHSDYRNSPYLRYNIKSTHNQLFHTNPIQYMPTTEPFCLLPHIQVL